MPPRHLQVEHRQIVETSDQHRRVIQRPGRGLFLAALNGLAQGTLVLRRLQPHHTGITRTGVVERVHQPRVGGLGRRPDLRAHQRTNGLLRERREGTQRLDLVTEPVHANGAVGGGRVHVQQPTPHRHLAPLLHLWHALVPQRGETVHEVAHVNAITGCQHHRCGALGCRRHALHQCGRAGNHHVPRGPEHSQRASAQAHQMR